MHPIDMAYHDLANAIVAQAVEDYRNALDGITYSRANKHITPEYIIKSVEKFFRSDYFRILTKVNPEYLIEQLRKEHREKLERRANESNPSTSNT
jgi:predicted glycoside hydrolase/deacetylase ChbG (UPF0249 family)